MLQIGDLFFSFLKRKAKIKDTGNFLPGHGGILDRLDGILSSSFEYFKSDFFLIDEKNNFNFRFNWLNWPLNIKYSR